MGKTNPLNENDLKEFILFAKNKKISENSWSIDIEKINKETLDLSVSNPNIVEKIDERTPEEIVSEIEELDMQNAIIIKKIKSLL